MRALLRCVLQRALAAALTALRGVCAASAAKGKPSLKAGFLEGDMDDVAYANTALDDDYDFSASLAMASRGATVLTRALSIPLPAV